jgi:hypothetical protein
MRALMKEPTDLELVWKVLSGLQMAKDAFMLLEARTPLNTEVKRVIMSADLALDEIGRVDSLLLEATLTDFVAAWQKQFADTGVVLSWEYTEGGNMTVIGRLNGQQRSSLAYPTAGTTGTLFMNLDVIAYDMKVWLYGDPPVMEAFHAGHVNEAPPKPPKEKP